MGGGQQMEAIIFSCQLRLWTHQARINFPVLASIHLSNCHMLKIIVKQTLRCF